ncbi:MAG TPA: hypothetical protein VHO69_18330, partial [Phototrophicaceae bacterium]|nr:hypothetical protein [Phototrophicaceae bacterium]
FEVVNVSSSRNPFELKEGDVVTTINGQAVADLNLETLLSDLADAETPELTVVVTRDGEEVTLTGSFVGGRMDFGMRGQRDGSGMPDMPGRGNGFGQPGQNNGFGGRGGHDGQFPQSPNDTPDTTPEPEANGSV